MECKNHPGTNAFDRCAGCAESFCPNCLVEMDGVKYCGACKVLALRGRPIQIEAALVPCKRANSALLLSIIGIFLLAIVLEPIAIAKAVKAKEEIDADLSLSGGGKANAALMIAIARLCLGFFLFMIYMTSRAFRT